MDRPKASVSGSGVPLVAEPSKSGHWEKVSRTSSSEFLGNSNVIVLDDSEDESAEAGLTRSPSPFGTPRALETAPLLQLDQEDMLSPSQSSESRKMKHSRKRVLAVEDPGSASRFNTKFPHASPSLAKTTTVGVPLQGNYIKAAVVTTGVGPAFDLDTASQETKALRKRKSGGKGDIEVGAEQDNKENKSMKVQAGNGVKSESNGKKRKTEVEVGVDPESSSKRSQSSIELATDGSVASERKTCHQCRQRHGLALAWCKETTGKRSCTQKFCAKCLRNRYGEILAEVQARDSWSCPRCRGICNCSMCMKKRGLAPTGGLAKQALAAGYSSVADLLQKFPNVREERYSREENAASVSNGSKEGAPTKQDSISPRPLVDDDDFETSVPGKKSRKDEVAFVKESATSGGEQGDGVKKKRMRRTKSEMEASAAVHRVEGHSAAVQQENEVKGEASMKKRKGKKSKAKVQVEQDLVKEDMIGGLALEAFEEDIVEEELPVEEEIVLPTGSPLVKVGDVTLPPEAVGPALQFLEFCSTFEKPLRLKRAKPPRILAEMLRGGTLRRGSQSEIVQFHAQLISIILDDLDDDTNVTMSAASKNCWVYHLERHLSEQFFLSTVDVEGEQREEEEEYDDRSVAASTSGTKILPLSYWPIPGEDIVAVLKALRSGVDGYGNLSVTTRLQILATLCDSILTTKKMRDYLEKVMNSREVEQKENREELLAVKKQAREIHENSVNEVLAAKKDNVSLDVRDVEKLKREYAELADKEAQLTETAAKLSGAKCEALRAEPEAVHRSGSRFWRLKGGKDKESILLQGISNLGSGLPTEEWSVFLEEQEEEVMRCITNLNTRKKAPAKIPRRVKKRKAPVSVENQASISLPEVENQAWVKLPEVEVPVIELSD
ncbi:hypothetical protein R1flu_014007 [Riccia fluitans]|uniref:DDT domain-containing protein n=1 Tax=Riccia fluitans TaxID=41844 RepID=A0ABD1YEX0_9MARC